MHEDPEQHGHDVWQVHPEFRAQRRGDVLHQQDDGVLHGALHRPELLHTAQHITQLCTIQNSCTLHNTAPSRIPAHCTSHNSAPPRTPVDCTALHHPELPYFIQHALTIHHTILHVQHSLTIPHNSACTTHHTTLHVQHTTQLCMYNTSHNSACSTLTDNTTHNSACTTHYTTLHVQHSLTTHHTTLHVQHITQLCMYNTH